MIFVKSILNEEGTELSVRINKAGDISQWRIEDIKEIMFDHSEMLSYGNIKYITDVKEIFNIHWYDRDKFIIYYNTNDESSPTFIYISDMDIKMRDLKISKVII